MKLVVPIVIIVVILAGGFFGLAKTGVVTVPGVSPANPSPETKTEPEEARQDPKAEEPQRERKHKGAPPRMEVSVEPKRVDVEEGNARLAKLWNEVETESLVKIIKDWKDMELAAVLARMAPDKVAELLAELDPGRASKLSREIQKKASLLN